MEKNFCINCGAHKDNYRFLHCYGDKHITGFTKEESIKEFPKETYIDMKTGKMKCYKCRETIKSQDELRTLCN